MTGPSRTVLAGVAGRIAGHAQWNISSGQPLKLPQRAGLVMPHVYSFPADSQRDSAGADPRHDARKGVAARTPVLCASAECVLADHPGGVLHRFDPALPYAARVALVQAAGIAVWDVLKSCIRPSSLEPAIDAASAVPNDFATSLAGHPPHPADLLQRGHGRGAVHEAHPSLILRPGRRRAAHAAAVHEPGQRFGAIVGEDITGVAGHHPVTESGSACLLSRRQAQVIEQAAHSRNTRCESPASGSRLQVLDPVDAPSARPCYCHAP